MKKTVILFSAVMMIILGFHLHSSHATENDAQLDDSAEITMPYAVHLDDWVRTIKLDDGSSHQTTARRFIREPNPEKDLPISIDINVADLNPNGMGIYFNMTQDGPSIFYPITIENTQTKEITILDNKEKPRKVFVNTEVKIQANVDKEDVLNVVNDTYYLFYNKKGGLSLAINPIQEDKVNETSKSATFLEYLSTPTDATETNEDTNSQIEPPLSSDTNYYDQIKKAWADQQDYINATEDPKIKQSLQTAQSAATMKAEELTLQDPDDLPMIQAALKKVLDER